ncbi:Cell division control 6 [Chlorella sorokiniana]|uniref:Cell division control 6 n=1 Tax=Chlorella sorokiniana TaxID=3076 RepID=A0A2P6TBH2_CHLSO|nr:Cell division control 6 [Chlorella sorokiniana]|eukprot:PRW05904.1 Cell division control 6 [Chlorella sorokiniana]
MCYIAACGVADPKAVLLQSPPLFVYDHGALGFLQRRLLLQHAFQLTATQLYGQQAYCIARREPLELAQRLQFVEQRGQAHRLVAKAKVAQLSAARPALAAPRLTAALPRRVAAPPPAPRGRPVVTWAAARPEPGSGGQRMRANTSVQRSKDSKTGSLTFKQQAALAAGLQPLADLAGVNAAAAERLCSKVATRSAEFQNLVVQHGAAVAQMLLALGVEQGQLAQLLSSCPELFTWTAAVRGRLPARFEELLQLLMPDPEPEDEDTAAKIRQAAATAAAQCFIAYPEAAIAGSFAPAINVLAPVGSHPDSLVLRPRQLARVLECAPATVELLCQPVNELQRGLDTFQQRYLEHWRKRDSTNFKNPYDPNAKIKNPDDVLAGCLRKKWQVLLTDPAHLTQVEQMLQRSIGQEPGDGTRFVVYCIWHHPWLVYAHEDPDKRAAMLDELELRADALAAEFGRPRLCGAQSSVLPALLSVDTAVWQMALAVWEALGVPDPKGLAIRCPYATTCNWLSVDRMANSLALQRLLPEQPTLVEVVEYACARVAATSTERLIGRLLHALICGCRGRTRPPRPREQPPLNAGHARPCMSGGWDSSFAVWLTDSDEEEFLSPAPAAVQAAAAAAVRPDSSLQQGEGQRADAMARGKTRRSNATMSTPAGKKAGAAGGGRKAAAAQQRAAAAGTREPRARKRAASTAAKPADEEQENKQVQNAAAADDVGPPQKRQRRGSAAGAGTPAAAALSPAAGSRRTRGSAGKQQQAKQPAKQQPQEQQEEEAERQRQATAAAPEPQQQQQQVELVVRRRPRQQQQPLTSQGLQPSQSIHDSILKSPSPGMRARPSGSIAARPSIMHELRAAGAAAVEQGAVDQPVAQQAQQVQQAEPAPAAAAVEPEAAAGEPAAEQQPQQAQQQGAAEQAAAGFERTGSSPLQAPGAKRQRTSPRRSPKPLPTDSGRPGGSVRFDLPAGTAAGPSNFTAGAGGSPGTSTAAQRGAEAAADAWWDPLDPEKVQAVKQVLHISGYVKGTIPLCREKQAGEVGGWLRRQMAAGRGSSMYLSGPPGTGKSLTAHEVVRQCWRPAPPTGGEQEEEEAQQQGQLPPPALISINCMSLTDPQQVVERILLGYSQACAAPHPEAAMAAGEDPIVYPAAEGASAAASSKTRRRSASDPLQQLQRLVLLPLPGAAGAAAKPAAGRRGSGKKSAGRGQKRKSAGSGAAAAGAAAAGERGWLVVILDELDSLLSGSRGEELVEKLFVLAHAERSRLLLLGIANSIDLVQQLMRQGGPLQRNNLRCGHEPFPAYLKTQFSRVLHQRLELLPGRAFQPNTIEFCCRRMYNGNGDMRLALESCSLAAEVAARAAAQAAAEAAAAAAKAAAGGQGSQGNEGSGSPTSVPPKAGSKLIAMPHMAEALNTVCGGLGASRKQVESLKALPPQQQLMMATLGKLLGDLLPSRGLTVRQPAAMPTPSTARKAGGKGAAASRARASFMSPANSLSSRKSAGSLLSAGGSVTSGMPRSREVLLGQLEEAFTGLCRQLGMKAYTSGEFSTACDNLQGLGLLDLVEAREPKWRRVTLKVPEDDIILALSDVPVLYKAIAG